MAQEVIDRDTLIAFACGKLSHEESLRVMAEVERNDAFSCDLEEVLLVMRAAKEEEHEREDARRRRAINEPTMRYLLRLAAVIVVGLLSVVSVSELTKGRYHDLARVADVDFSGRWRGDVDEEIEWARREFMGGDQDHAIRELERVIQTRPAGESMAVVHWMVGAMLLGTAEQSVMGLFPRYDENRVVRAMGHLTLALQSNNIRVIEKAHWLRMKGSLMLNKPREAIREGEEVVKSGGEGVAEVMVLLREIEDR